MIFYRTVYFTRSCRICLLLICVLFTAVRSLLDQSVLPVFGVIAIIVTPDAKRRSMCMQCARTFTTTCRVFLVPVSGYNSRFQSSSLKTADLKRNLADFSVERGSLCTARRDVRRARFQGFHVEMQRLVVVVEWALKTLSVLSAPSDSTPEEDDRFGYTRYPASLRLPVFAALKPFVIMSKG